MGWGHILISRERSRLPLRHCLLTFDDGPSGDVTEELLGVLREVGIRACFCVIGSRVAARPEQTQSIARHGHLLVNHTFHHRARDLWHFSRLQAELDLCDQAVASATGTAGRALPWFRPPFGIITPAVREIARQRRILPITHFAFDSWFNSPQTTRPGYWITENAKRQGGGIYLLHDGLMSGAVRDFLRGQPHRGWVPRAVKKIAGSLLASGFQFPEPSEVLAALDF